MIDDEREIDIMDSVMERIAADGFDALTEPEQNYFGIWWVTAEADNGSFDQFFRNSSGEFAHVALRGLAACGAHQMAALLREAMELFPSGEVPADQEQRWAAMNALSKTQQCKLDKLSNQFIDYPDDLWTLLEAYVRLNDASFLGPKTLMEQWTARRARGAETVPRSAFEVDLDRETAKDATSTDRKCPICGQPAPEYRRTCKRCGYPYGRVVEQ